MRAHRHLQLVQMLEEIPIALDVFRDVKALLKDLQLEALQIESDDPVKLVVEMIATFMPRMIGPEYPNGT